MSKADPIIAKLTIQIGDTQAAVTLDQARKLHAALSEMFGVKEKETIVYRDRDWSWPWARPYWQYNYGATSLSNADMNQKALGLLDATPKVSYTSADHVHRDSLNAAGLYLLAIE